MSKRAKDVIVEENYDFTYDTLESLLELREKHGSKIVVDYYDNDLDEAIERLRELHREQEEWAKENLEAYLDKLKGVESVLNELYQMAPPVIRKSELDPFGRIDSILGSLSHYNDVDMWQSSELC